jgi:alpha-L-arabinofuranosidase
VYIPIVGGNGQRQQAPYLLEEEYNLEDPLLVGGLVNALLRRSDKVRVACLAQLVNVIAPIVTNANGLLRQSIYYPYTWVSAGFRITFAGRAFPSRQEQLAAIAANKNAPAVEAPCVRWAAAARARQALLCRGRQTC